MATFEFGLGTVIGLSRERMLSDYNVAAGGFMGFGLSFMFFAPALAARTRRLAQYSADHSLQARRP